MCEQGMMIPVAVKIPADLSCDGEEHWKAAKIDSCIADLVRALQMSGIDMCGSCCGHGKTLGSIDLADGRALLILEPDDACDYRLANSDEERVEILSRVMYRWCTLLSRRGESSQDA